jgi:uncharacterized protein YbcI
MAGGTNDRDAGQSLLARISTEMVRALKEHFGKGPVEAKSYFLDDMLLVVMKGGLTTAEKTMLDFDEPDSVRDFRQAFENRMTDHLTQLIEDLTGRNVVTYQSQIMFDPDRIVEIFVFDDTADEALVRATAEGQLRGEPVGEVAAGDVGRDEPSSSGQSG